MINKGVIREEADLLECADVEFFYTSDDGLIPMEQFNEKFRLPLYYTDQDILRFLLNRRKLFSTRYHHLTDFYSYSSDLSVNGKSRGDIRPDTLGKPVLAEALTIAKNNRLTLVYGHREELVSRAGPYQCVYGCPVSPELEKKYEGTMQFVEEAL